MKPAAATDRTKAENIREKFFRLLEMDRESPEFERLFREVDEALARLAAEQADVSP